LAALLAHGEPKKNRQHFSPIVKTPKKTPTPRIPVVFWSAVTTIVAAIVAAIRVVDKPASKLAVLTIKGRE